MDQVTDRALRSNVSPTGPRATRWIVLVARGEEELYEYLRRAFQGDEHVEVVMDRRRDLRRNEPWIVERLRTHGAAVIRADG